VYKGENSGCSNTHERWLRLLVIPPSHRRRKCQPPHPHPHTHTHSLGPGAEEAGVDSSQPTLAMEQVASINPDDLLAPAPKRRKLRKGTSSCWECKRRKARCSFSTADGAVDNACHGCKLRGTPCISQDLPDQPAPGGSNRHLVDRLAQVEALVGRLVQAADQSQHGDSSLSPPMRQQQPHLPAVIGEEIPPFLTDYPFLFSSDYSGVETPFVCLVPLKH
jgi:hypothetical protein